ncbi:RNA polymerase sigma factor [Sunxiuqinia rutila]|uniref:RNA polymerase sigma factor n=1 Tax=Sunxiuqinia rutila TaxID=1397841 RepID=UPI003D369F6C
MAIKSNDIERDLIRELKAGDRKAFQQVFNAYSERLFHFAYSYLKDVNETEEIVQDVFLRLWEIKSEIDVEKSFKSFLYKITVNKVFNHLKRQIVRQKYEDYVLKLEPEYPITPEESLSQKELEANLLKMLGKLPEQKRKIFELSKLKGFSNAEIAEQLGVSVRTVENQVYRASKFLRERLAEEHLLLLLMGLLVF